MELYLFIVVALFGFAIADLAVGVSNDAVNFLNSAVGSRVAPRWIIMLIASAGIMLGVLFSSGMMEVARKGIFHPEYFLLSELLVLFLAVAITDLLLLDLYNTFGLPTSTTVSIIFELIGAAVAVSMIKIIQSGDNLAEMINYINSAKALAIISGILVSIIIAFTCGSIIQFFTRLIFTFDFEKNLRRFGSIWGGLALTAINYFILIKGAEDASFITENALAWIQTHTWMLLGINFLVFTLIFQLLTLFTKINILKPIILIGTGALAMAFAANDLVNFIGVPLAGFNAYQIALASPDNPLVASMEGMNGKIKTDSWMLLVAGIIMVVTLWISKKARTVTKTEVGLGRQDDENDERFEATGLSRIVVRMAMSLARPINLVVPETVRNKINARFEKPVDKKKKKDLAAFDLLRASVNLVVSSALISIGTSLKLPLSTTYVTFMVAMGSSLSDRAWGRDSAVYRVTGVLTVIGGWFFTAFMAFTVAFLLALLIYYFRLPAIIFLILAAIYFVLHTNFLHKKRERERDAEETEHEHDILELSPVKEFDTILVKMHKYLHNFLDTVCDTFEGMISEKRDVLRQAVNESKKLEKNANKLITRFYTLLQIHENDADVDVSPEILTALKESSRRLRELSSSCLVHVENKHSGFSDVQVQELEALKKVFTEFVLQTEKALEQRNKQLVTESRIAGEHILHQIRILHKNQIKRIKKGAVKTRRSLLYYGILANIESITIQFMELGKGLVDTKLFK
ncbi:MAG TPA: inorganic phosphate transporter [bacterium]|nr:inorganic phosphate transporter [bacterium]HPN42877.1 inorganic phosphate transporter [bacterium]